MKSGPLDIARISLASLFLVMASAAGGAVGRRPAPPVQRQPPRLVLTTGHSDTVTGAEFLAGNTLVATASTDGTARVWRRNSGEPVSTLVHGAPISHLASAGNIVVTAGEDG